MTDPAPDGVTVDCTTGEITCVPLTPDQIAAQQAAAAAYAQQQQAEAAAQAQLVATVQASTDPAMQALAQLTGVIPSPGTDTPESAPTVS